jgi:hypothetical protein
MKTTFATQSSRHRLFSSILLVSLAAAAACKSDDDVPSTNNGVPSPDAGSSMDGSSSTSGGGGDAANSTGDDGSSGDSGSLTDTDALVESGPSAESGAMSDGGASGGPCSSLPGTIVYVESGDTQENLLKNLGRHLRDTSNITLVFNLTGSCALTNDIYTAAKMVPNGSLKYIPSTAENPSWTASQPEATCTTGPDGAPIDVAISALFVESCGLGGPPDGSNLALIQGPIQAYTFVVPSASTQNAIWAEEAYYAFGFGNNNPLAPQYNPWNNEQLMFIRPATKSTLVATAKNIALPPNKWKGVPENASTDVVNAVAGAITPEPAIGILGAEVYDGSRTKGIKTLAFQAFGQHGAYYPDSVPSAYDKQNVRDGHYALWSPTVYITKVGAGNVPSNPAVKSVIDLVLGNGVASADSGLPFDGLADVVKVGLIPECAMQVSRTDDGGDLSPFHPDSPCSCYYLSKITGGSATPAGCEACTADAECGDAGARCSHGFCEPSGSPPAFGDSGACFSGVPTTHDEIINACTSAQSLTKDVVLPGDGGLQPLP